MAEKVIGEIRFIETKDGFRVEIKGDKERLRQMGWSPGMGFGSGKRFWRKKWYGGRHGHGHGHHHRHGHHGPPPPPGVDFDLWGWWDWWSDELDEDDDDMPPKGV